MEQRVKNTSLDIFTVVFGSPHLLPNRYFPGGQNPLRDPHIPSTQLKLGSHRFRLARLTLELS